MELFRQRRALNEMYITLVSVRMAGKAALFEGVGVDEERTVPPEVVEFITVFGLSIADVVLLDFLFWMFFVFPD